MIQMYGEFVKSSRIADDDGEILMQQMHSWFAEHMPQVRTELRRKNGVYTDPDPELYAEIQEEGDAAVFGVGH